MFGRKSLPFNDCKNRRGPRPWLRGTLCPALLLGVAFAWA